MSAKDIFVEKLERQSKEKLQKLKKEIEKHREQHKFANIFLLQCRPLERGPPFPSPVSSSSSSQRSSPISKFEKAFEEILRNERDCKETLRRYNFRKPRREVCPSEQIDPISIFDSEE
jgi:hypothetical protein